MPTCPRKGTSGSTNPEGAAPPRCRCRWPGRAVVLWWQLSMLATTGAGASSTSSTPYGTRRVPRDREFASDAILAEHTDSWGIILGITLGINRGITLEDHPLSLTKPLFTGAEGGSAGSPDSPAHKPIDTSGRPPWPALLLLDDGQPALFDSLIPSPSRPCCLALGIAISVRSRRRGWVADLRKLATVAGSVIVHTAFSSPTATAEVRGRKES